MSSAPMDSKRTYLEKNSVSNSVMSKNSYFLLEQRKKEVKPSGMCFPECAFGVFLSVHIAWNITSWIYP